MTPPRRRLLPPAYALMASAVGVLLSFVDVGAPSIPLFARGLGGFGVVLAVGAAAHLSGRFSRLGTTIKPFQESSALVTDGLYRFSRNPMYVCILTAITGFMLALGSWLSLVVVPPLALLLDRRFIVREEEMLRDTFGDAYEAYARRTRRWL